MIIKLVKNRGYLSDIDELYIITLKGEVIKFKVSDIRRLLIDSIFGKVYEVISDSTKTLSSSTRVLVLRQVEVKIKSI